MTILDEIHYAKWLCLDRNHSPTSIYLGRKQIARLDAWLREHRYLLVDDFLYVSRQQISGMYVYKVDDEDHCVAA